MPSKIIVATVLGLVRVIDGDTLSVGGHSYRLVGFNSPEIHGQCPKEIASARAAKAKMLEIVHSPGFNLARVQCAQGPLDKYGRFCGQVTVSGQDVAPIMISAGLAEPYVCTHTCPARRDWCKN